MEHKIIHTEDYLLVVSDEKIKDVTLHKGKWQLEKGYILNQFPDYLTDLSDCKIVIAHLPLNNSPILEGVDLLPPLQDNGRMGYPNSTIYFHLPYSLYLLYKSKQYVGFIDDYNKAKEHKYTERQLDVAIDWAIKKGREGDVTITDIDNFIQSLSQPKLPVAFKCEMDKKVNDIGNDGFEFDESSTIPKPKIKKTTNEQYQTIWVGEYKF